MDEGSRLILYAGVPILLAYVISFAANMALKGAMRDLGGRVRTPQDLTVVRTAINGNKAFAWGYLLLWGATFLAYAAGAFGGAISMSGAAKCIFAFGVLTLPGGLWSKSVESKFKAMTVDKTDPALPQTFSRYLVDWRKPSLKIPE